MALIPRSLLFLFSVLGALFLSMGFYAAAGPRPDADQRAKGGQLFGGAGDFVLHWFMWVLTPVERLSLSLRLTPDAFNYIGLLLGLSSGVLIATGHLVGGGWAIALCGVADIMDGRIARSTGVASDYGDFIDSTFDRFVEAAAFLGFAYYLRQDPWGPLLAGAALGGSQIVSYTRARGEVLGVKCTGGLMQRGERLVLTCLVCLLAPGLGVLLHVTPGLLVRWVLGLIAAGTAITAVHRTIWIARRLREPAGGSHAR
jgi:CDP-diacylglycerol--glycerol-3-phosphate 3-phosphatidyltransferase